MEVDGPEMAKIRKAVAKAGITIVLGYSERSSHSIYMAQTAINPKGEIVNHRRKIKPTCVERGLWGEGQGKIAARHAGIALIELYRRVDHECLSD